MLADPCCSVKYSIAMEFGGNWSGGHFKLQIVARFAAFRHSSSTSREIVCVEERPRAHGVGRAVVTTLINDEVSQASGFHMPDHINTDVPPFLGPEPQPPVAPELRGVDTEMEHVTDYLSTTSDTSSDCENVPEERAHEVDEIRGSLFGGPTTERSPLI
ncbi:hypothetical protein EMWEY_00054620 [Eimeria maxima]|uniref:Uncharacterized protein n=1 Tax=Eimeria maxima TaxID=5804 RepID=U6M7A0_EIMMA|nr:hypothetical protein EMWEY_00054620 [Eimeria maxima]CDJ58948.1 hypothetical protein EMWEY_00054620 [Eimeria maxima]